MGEKCGISSELVERRLPVPVPVPL